MKVYQPLPYRKPNKVIKEYNENYKCKAGNTGVATYVDYIDSKGKLIKKYFLRIKWD